MKFIFANNHCTPLEASVMAIITYTLFSLCDAMGKWLQSEGFAFSFILVATSLPSLIALTAIRIKKHGIHKAWHTDYKIVHVIRALALVGVTIFLFKAIALLPLANFYGIVFSTPFLITIGAHFFFKEPVTLIEWIAIGLGFLGVLVIANPSLELLNIGYLYAFAQALCITVAALSVRKIGKNEDPLIFVIFANIGIVLANIYPAWGITLPEVTTLHLFIFCIYALMIPSAILMMSAVFAKAPSVTNITPFQYSQIIWGAVIGYFVFNTLPTINVVIGSLIVIACGLYLLFHTHKSAGKRKEKHHTVSIHESQAEHERKDTE